MCTFGFTVFGSGLSETLVINEIEVFNAMSENKHFLIQLLLFFSLQNQTMM